MRILVAGVGNIFFGDDGFGVEVVRRLQGRPIADRVSVIDFGIRGLDLAYALLDGYGLVLLVDAVRRRGIPGTLCVLEPDVADSSVACDRVESHAMVLDGVFQFARRLDGSIPPVRLIGCVPAVVGESGIGLSEPVQRAVEPAIDIIESLITEALGRS
jgi:hydrogenase maturation protease